MAEHHAVHCRAATIHLHRHDLPAGLALGPVVAVDTETMGLNPHRDRLCLVQLSAGDGSAHLVQIIPPALGGRGCRLPEPEGAAGRPGHAEADAFRPLRRRRAAARLGITVAPVNCTKIAAKLVRTFTDRHGLKDLCRELLGVELSKQQQTSDWGAAELTAEQLAYAASDVLHLHALWAKLEALLVREGRLDLAQACFAFLPTRARLDLLGWDDAGHFRALTPAGRLPMSIRSACARRICNAPTDFSRLTGAPASLRLVGMTSRSGARPPA